MQLSNDGIPGAELTQHKTRSSLSQINVNLTLNHMDQLDASLSKGRLVNPGGKLATTGLTKDFVITTKDYLCIVPI